MEGTSGRLLVFLLRTLFGLRRSMKDWNIHFTSVMAGADFVQNRADQCLYSRTDETGTTIVYVHVDDLLIVGTEGTTEKLSKYLSEQFLYEDFGLLKLGGTQRFLGTDIKETKKGYDYDLSNRKELLDSIFQDLGFKEATRTLSLPCIKEPAAPDAADLEPYEDPTFFRSIVGRLLYLGQLRPDMQYGIKEAARHFTAPTVGSFNAAVRLSRYLLGTRDYVMKLEPNDKQQLVVYTDSDWGAQKETRRSTSGILVLYAGCVVQNLSRTQGTAAGSSGEAEFYAIGSGATEALGAASILADLGVRLTPVLYSDASAGISLARRQGFGKARHIELKYLMVQGWVAEQRLYVRKEKTEKNPADILTKAVDTATLLRHLETCGLVNKKTSSIS